MRKYIFAIIFLVFSQPVVAEELVVPPFSLAKLSVPSTATGIEWKVDPSKDVSVADTEPYRFQFVAPPGKYVVSVRYRYNSVRYSGSIDVVFKASDEPKPKNKESVNSLESISRVRFGNSFCSAVLLPLAHGPCYYALTAAHCISHIGQEGRFSTRSGNENLRAVVVASNRSSDWALIAIPGLVPAEKDNSTIYVAKISSSPYVPQLNEKVWHSGFGIDKPGNIEEGRFVGGPDSSGQYQYILSVSPGDSGGGIFSETDILLSPVCCTTAPSRVGRVWGAAPQSWLPAYFRFSQASAMADKQMPVKPEEGENKDDGDKDTNLKERAREYIKHIIALYVVDLVRARQLHDDSTKPVTTKEVIQSMGNKYDALIDLLLEDLDCNSKPSKLLDFIEKHRDEILRIARLVFELIIGLTK